MTVSAAERAFIARAIEVADYVRFSWRRDRSRPPQREWFHFVVHAPDVDVIVNFSLVEQRSEAAAMGNVLIMARGRGDVGALWEGDLDEYELKPSDVGTGRVRVRMGECSLEFDGAFRVRGTCRRRRLSVDLTLTPRAFPCFVQNVSVGDGSVVHWLIAPDLSATGLVRWGDRALRLDAARAYHDHNWGTFHGGDLSWEWGCAFGEASESRAAASVVFVRLLNRARSTVVAQGLLLWDGAHRRRELRGAQVAFEREGWLRPPHLLRVPRALSLLSLGAATDIPARLRVRGASSGDAVTCEFVSDDAAQVVVPRETDLGATLVHEVVGRLRFSGTLDGRPVEFEAPSFCEFLGEAP